MKQIILLSAILTCAVGCDRESSEIAATGSVTAGAFQLPSMAVAASTEEQSASSAEVTVQSTLTGSKPKIQDVFITGVFDPAKALTAMFGESWEWSPNQSCNKNALAQTASAIGGEGFAKSFLEQLASPTSMNHAEAYSVLEFDQGTKHYAYFIFQTAIDSCTACSALFGVAKWEQDEDQWRLLKSEKCLAPLGGAGGFNGTVQLAITGDHRYGIVIHDDYDDTRHTLIAAEDDQGELKSIFAGKTKDGNTQGRSSCGNAKLMGLKAECWKFTSTISFVPGQNLQHYDLAIKTSGKNMDDDGKIIPYAHNFVYRYKDGAYTEVLD